VSDGIKLALVSAIGLCAACLLRLETNHTKRVVLCILLITTLIEAPRFAIHHGSFNFENWRLVVVLATLELCLLICNLLYVTFAIVKAYLTKTLADHSSPMLLMFMTSIAGVATTAIISLTIVTMIVDRSQFVLGRDLVALGIVLAALFADYLLVCMLKSRLYELHFGRNSIARQSIARQSSVVVPSINQTPSKCYRRSSADLVVPGHQILPVIPVTPSTIAAPSSIMTPALRPNSLATSSRSAKLPTLDIGASELVVIGSDLSQGKSTNDVCKSSAYVLREKKQSRLSVNGNPTPPKQDYKVAGHGESLVELVFDTKDGSEQKFTSHEGSKRISRTSSSKLIKPCVIRKISGSISGINDQRDKIDSSITALTNAGGALSLRENRRVSFTVSSLSSMEQLHIKPSYSLTQRMAKRTTRELSNVLMIFLLMITITIALVVLKTYHLVHSTKTKYSKCLDDERRKYDVIKDLPNFWILGMHLFFLRYGYTANKKNKSMHIKRNLALRRRSGTCTQGVSIKSSNNNSSLKK